MFIKTPGEGVSTCWSKGPDALSLILRRPGHPPRSANNKADHPNVTKEKSTWPTRQTHELQALVCVGEKLPNDAAAQACASHVHSAKFFFQRR